MGSRFRAPTKGPQGSPKMATRSKIPARPVPDLPRSFTTTRTLWGQSEAKGAQYPSIKEYKDTATDMDTDIDLNVEIWLN